MLSPTGATLRLAEILAREPGVVTPSLAVCRSL
eukprot:SAG22_NODE_16178_length_331_cov_0.883621_1_plen_32_part_10